MIKVEIRKNRPPLTQFVVSITDGDSDEWKESRAFNTSKDAKEWLMLIGFFEPEKAGDPMWPDDLIASDYMLGPD